MTISTWNGSTADFSTSADWSPEGPPGPGDTGVIAAGVVMADSVTLDGFTLRLSGDGATTPTLEMTDSTLGAGLRILVQSAGDSGSAANGLIEVSGTVSDAGRITVGTSAAPALLQVQLATPATEFVASGIIQAEAGSTIGITGGQVVDAGMMFAVGGTLDLGSQVTGTGKIVIERDAAGQGGTVIADQTVGSGVDVLMHGGTLELGSPHFFLGTLMGWDSGTTLELLHTAVTSATLNGGVLTLSDGFMTEAQIKVAGSYSSADFHLSEVNGNTLITNSHIGPYS